MARRSHKSRSATVQRLKSKVLFRHRGSDEVEDEWDVASLARSLVVDGDGGGDVDGKGGGEGGGEGGTGEDGGSGVGIDSNSAGGDGTAGSKSGGGADPHQSSAGGGGGSDAGGGSSGGSESGGDTGPLRNSAGGGSSSSSKGSHAGCLHNTSADQLDLENAERQLLLTLKSLAPDVDAESVRALVAELADVQQRLGKAEEVICLLVAQAFAVQAAQRGHREFVSFCVLARYLVT